MLNRRTKQKKAQDAATVDCIPLTRALLHLLGYSVIIFIIVLIYASNESRRLNQFGLSNYLPQTLAVQTHPTLVVYVYSATDPEYINNLNFFIREAVHADDGCEYVIIIQQSPTLPNVSLPTLPSNARYLYHPNECFDLGTVGWFFKSQIFMKLEKYKYFIWLNSSVRGPFLPSYLRGFLHWTRPFTSKLQASNGGLPAVKVVGSTISCEGAGYGPEPHVQSYVVVTDNIGLKILLNTTGVFDCWKTMPQVILHSEIGASRAILNAGYNLDCLMARYGGIDWRKFRNASFDASEKRPCNMGQNPYYPDSNDGINVHPYEVMFVKVKKSLLEDKWPHAMAAVVLDKWLKYLDAGEDLTLDAAQENAAFVNGT